MIKGYSACIETLYTDLDFDSRPAAARRDGFDAVEFWQWIRHDMDAMYDSGMPVALALVDSKDVPTHDLFKKIGMLRPESAPLFADMLDETLCALKKIKPGYIVTTPGQFQTDLPGQAQGESIVDCLKAAVPVLKKHGAKLLIEPLNSRIDHPGCYLSSSDQAYEIVRSVGDPDIGVLFDIYHQQVTEGNIIQRLVSGMDVVQYVHIADCPGRHEPGTGELNYRNILAAAEKAGFAGYAGFEFYPTTDTTSAVKRAFDICKDGSAV